DVIAGQLEQHQVQLLKDVSMFNHLYDMNTQYFKELTMYIIAGEKKLEEVRSGDLVTLKNAAEQSGDAMDAQRANDLAANCDRFEKKIHDLKLTRQVALQMAPQIRLLQNNDSLLVERIQSTLSNTLPLWKSQILIALGMHRSQEALKAQTAVTDMTNELLQKNAEALKVGTIETAREAERGIIDLETLKRTNQSLMDTINEVMRIHEDGRSKRMVAEQELATMEVNLKKKLLEVRT
ncbi:MAG: toxic anion resistance protein, partial [Clostridia bacterium]|nr:toxic anion resistance protein [Clostridia bacterium]